MKKERWDIIIKPKTKLLDIDIKEIWSYKDLLLLLIRRDFVAIYKQTILGPLWFFIQPLFQTIIFTIAFGRIANIPTHGIPHMLFYLSGITMWNYFAECVNTTSSTFTQNASIFGKVYFPRVVVPISIVGSNLIKFVIQLLLFLAFFIYYFIQGESIHINVYLLLFPLLVLLMAGLGLGTGMIISSLTTKYRDLTFLVRFGIQLLMYASPVIFPLSTVPEKYRIFVIANPMTSIIETFRYGLFQVGDFQWSYLLYTTCVVVAFLTFGLIIFNKVQKSFMDTV